MSSPLRFLQLSDVHFGARLTGGRLQLPAGLAEQRRKEKRECFARALDLVESRDLDGVLLPGDLFDGESIDTDTLRFVLHHLGRIAPRPVFLAPGNHDSYGGASPYEPRPEQNPRGLEWPDNVVLFAHEDFRSAEWPGRRDVRVIGCGVPSNTPIEQRRLAPRVPREPAELELLLFHGSRDDGGWLQAHKSTHPFSREELLAQDLDWVALGHYHDAQVIEDDGGRARGAYSGCLLAGGLDETGPKGALVVELSQDRCEVEFVPLDRRQVRRVSCDLSGAAFVEAAVERTLESLEAAGARADDLVFLELQGLRAKGLDLRFIEDLADRFLHLRVDTANLRPDVDLDRYPTLEEAQNTEERFVARLRPAMEGSEGETIRRALLYGLDALERGRIDTRYEA